MPLCATHFLLGRSSSVNCALINTGVDLHCRMNVSSCYTGRYNGSQNTLRSVSWYPYDAISTLYQYIVLADLGYRFALLGIPVYRRSFLMHLGVSLLCVHPTYLMFTTLLIYAHTIPNSSFFVPVCTDFVISLRHVTSNITRKAYNRALWNVTYVLCLTYRGRPFSVVVCSTSCQHRLRFTHVQS